MTIKGQHTNVTKTICSYCGVGCGIEVTKDKKGNLELRGDRDYPVNRGMLCSKGMNLHYTVQDQSDRLTVPKMRWSKHHPLETVDWDTALNRTAAVFKTLISKYGPDAVGFYVSGQCLTEEYYLVNKLAKGFIGTNNIDTNSRLCMSSAVAGYMKTVGEDSVPISYEDIEQADCFLIAGANPAWCHPIIYRRIEQHKNENPEVKVVVVDPRITDTASQADLHLQIRPGTDTYLYHALGRVLIEEHYIDQEFISNHTEGFEKYRELVFSRSVAAAAEICDIPEDQIRQAARYIGEAKGFITMWAMGLNQSTSGVNHNVALISLNLVTGKIGKPGSGPFSLTGQPNAMGGREVGGMATLLAAHKVQANPEHRDQVAKFWGVSSLPDKPGLTATNMFEALSSGRMKAVWIICTNPSVSMPNARLVDKALKTAKFVVVQDISNRSDTLAYADMILPAAGWLEKEGTMTNSERRIGYLPKLVTPPGEALPDSEILIRFARKMGYHGFDYSGMDQVYREYCALTKGSTIDISGLSYERLKSERSIQWPVPGPGHKGTPRLFTDGHFYTGSAKAYFADLEAVDPVEQLTPDLPLILTTGRIRDQWHTMTRTGKVSKLNQHIARPMLEMHPVDALTRSIDDNDLVVIENERGQVRLPVKLSVKIKPGVVFLPMHWGKILQFDQKRANNLTNSSVDPISKQPGFKFTAVQVTKFRKPSEKVIVVGAGAAAYRFINTYRKLVNEDEVHVFSKEIHPFYNRVLLPEYVNDNLVWGDLVKFKDDELSRLDISIHVGNSIEIINREAKTVTDVKGAIHSYDKLVLATGSRAFLPSDVPIHLPGVFTMRNRKDADDFKELIDPGTEVIIVGGGLLGIELAASLREVEVGVSIVQLSSRLMERQLDVLASTLLREKIEDLGIKVYTNDQVQELEQVDHQRITAKLKSGIHLQSRAVVYAIGTRPNIELARLADLSCGRGIKVNQFLQTSDPDIFAMGEIAEYDQRLNGITAAAEQQADCLAHYLSGDLTHNYQGSISMNILKVADFELCSLGMPEPPSTDANYQEIVFIDKSRHYYKKCLVKDDHLVGAILMGDKTEFPEFKRLIEENIELSEKRKELLRSGQTPKKVVGPLICACNNVGRGNIEQELAAGSTTLNAICQSTGAGLGCGSCKPEIQCILEEKTMVTKNL